ncbi:MAG TPA: lytic transglycosylase domain-containing protein [Allosphingosinicella sp.]|nr:lytic transglycosylase domain-containing protein [Allosphingosinicella sp.]
MLLLGASAAAVMAQTAPGPAPQAYARAPSSSVAADIERWNALRQSDSLPFSAYANFLVGHRGWPGEAGMRRAAEQRAAIEAVPPGEVLRFFSSFPPLTASGHASQAFALQAAGRAEEARAAARRAWTAGVLPVELEPRLLAAFGAGLTPDDHDRRMDVLLGNGDDQSAARTLMWAPPAKRALYEARLALQTRAPDAYDRVAALDPSLRRDGGLLIDQAIWLRNSSRSAAARELLASRGRLDRPATNPARYLDTALTLARGAANDRQWSTAYGIAARLDDLYAPGTDVASRPYDERDDYTSLAWLGGSTALFRLGRPADAARLFELYARAARSPQTRAKGFYWAARAANAAGNPGQASAWLEQAAASPDQFYGQLALERLGRGAPPPPVPPAPDPAERAAFAQRPLAEAVRYLGMTGRRADQTLFVRALAVQLANDRERAVAGEFGRAIGRLDLGVWAAREARSSGDSFYARTAFPEVPIPPAYQRNWAFAHGIMRQESSFERSAVSPVGARGMMQLMPGTARQSAGRVGVPYDLSRLTEDPQYNILLGNHHLSELMDEWGGNAVLVAAAYNAGSGNVRRWIASNGDPRMPGADVVRWIEEIPFSETRNYVQRVLENAVVYDLMNPARQGAPMRLRISQYLGQNPRG